MFTTCPKCSLKLVVTASDLRVAQGYVRCGRCSNVFNALAGLSDEQQAVLAREPAPASREPENPERQRITSANPEPAASAESEPGASANSERSENQPIADDALEFDASSTDVSEVFVQPADDDPTGTFESIVLRSDESETHEFEVDLESLVTITAAEPLPDAANQHALAALPPQPNDPVPASAAAPAPDRQANGAPVPALKSPPALQSSPALESTQAPAPPQAPASPLAPAPPPARESPLAPKPPPPASRPQVRSPHEAHGEELAAVLDPLSRARMTADEGESVERAHVITGWPLRVGSIALALLLVLQIVNHERAELAGLSWLRAPLTSVYAALGMPLAPHWNVHAYEVRQLGAIAGPRDPGALTVRASVKNTAPREQPLPLLRVTMQDRFGNRIAARDVPPSAYLPAGSSNRTDLGAGQRVDAEIAFADPGPNAVGFEIDACLELARGRIACANDASPQR
ncbi:MAG: zinc-ribbon and DUF3426 domain-containing protein [Steroidobacteraceae bacterium]